MTRVRVVFAAMLAVAMLGVVAGSASASVASANPKFCKAVEKIGTKGSSNPTKNEAKAALKGFKNAAKYAPGKVKSALNTIGKYLGKIADAKDAGDLAALGTGSGFKNYTSAIGTYVKYYSANCIGSS